MDQHFYHLKAIGKHVITVEATCLDRALLKTKLNYVELEWADEDGVTVWERT